MANYGTVYMGSLLSSHTLVGSVGNHLNMSESESTCDRRLVFLHTPLLDPPTLEVGPIH